MLLPHAMLLCLTGPDRPPCKHPCCTCRPGQPARETWAHCPDQQPSQPHQRPAAGQLGPGSCDRCGAVCLGWLPGTCTLRLGWHALTCCRPCMGMLLPSSALSSQLQHWAVRCAADHHLCLCRSGCKASTACSSCVAHSKPSSCPPFTAPYRSCARNHRRQLVPGRQAAAAGRPLPKAIHRRVPLRQPGLRCMRWVPCSFLLVDLTPMVWAEMPGAKGPAPPSCA